MKLDFITKHYARRGLWYLFVMAAFPIHIWTILLVLNDISWVSRRTNLGDAIGVGAYALVYALIESLLYFVLFVLLGYLLSGKWELLTRIALLCELSLITALWSIANQLYFFLAVSPPQALIRLLAGSAHPLWILYGSALALAGLSVVPLTYLVLRSKRVRQSIWGFAERLSLLAAFYLFFDAISLIIIIIRNL